MPAVLDAVPYRKGDGTAARDATRYPYIAGHGYACVRLDLRGSGDSDGLIPDEYTEQEQEDVEAVIAWLAAQPWCDGAVGMIGVSWGGFAALQAAARNPPALRGIVAIHSSDDRYADDVHYIGGCVLASDMVHWSACMAAYAGQPPDPAVVGEGWREAWRERVEAMEPWVATWLAHQRRDGYWRQGSACEHYDAIECPVFAVGGWVDGYRDSVLRLAEHVRGPVRGLIGPWGHTLAGARRARPGDRVPAGGRAVLRLRAEGRGERVPRRAAAGRVAGRPLGRRARVAVAERRDARAGAGGRAQRALAALTGLDGGVWCGDGGPADAPLDQRRDDAGSLCWDFEPLGRAARAARPRGRGARAERRPAGRVRRRAALRRRARRQLVADRARRAQPDAPRRPRPRRAARARRARDGARGDAVERRTSCRPATRCGSRVSADYWPWVWPSPEPVTLTVPAARSSCRCAAAATATRRASSARVPRRRSRRS